METVSLGATGLRVSAAGLGCGGDSHLGLDTGGSTEQAVSVIQRAVELGVTYFDTADEYGTEEVVGRALAPVRDDVVLTTKTKPLRPDGSLLDAAGLRANLEDSLERLRTDFVDVFFLHMVRARHYDHCLAELVPELLARRDAGAIRHIAITEGSRSDPGHEMLARALDDSVWEVVMLAFNPFNASARRLVFPRTIEGGVGTNVMCAARGPFSHPDEMRTVVRSLVAAGDLDAASVDLDDPLGFLVAHGAASVVEAAYRFARHEPGCEVVLTGTGSTTHLEQNIASINAGPLPAGDRETLDRLFGHLVRLTKD